MAKSEEKLKAFAMRREGKSIKEIAKQVGVSSGSVSAWVREIELTPEQRAFLTKRQIASGEQGRQKGADSNRERKEMRIREAREASSQRFSSLSIEQLFVLGLGLYWGEGSKSPRNKSLILTNSDPAIIKLMIRWFSDCFGVDQSRFRPRICIADTHRDREEILLSYWSKTLGLPVSQFSKTSFLPTGKKLYENRDIYYGVIALYIARGTAVRHLILAYIERLGALAMVMPA